MRVKIKSFPLLKILFFQMTILIFSLTGCSNNCPQAELQSFLDQIDTIHTTFTDLNNQAMNHPELKAGNVQKMNLMMEEFSQMEPPKCATKLSEKVLKAMESSITYLSPTQDVFYYPYQLAKFALDNWQAVEDAVADLLHDQS